MKPIKLKDLLNEMEMPNFPTEKEPRHHGADYVSQLIDKLTPEQQKDSAEIFNVLDQWFNAVKKENGDVVSAARSAVEALKWHDIDAGLVGEYLDNEAGAMDNPNDSDQY